MFLGTYPAEHFVEEKAKAAAVKLRESFDKITAEIEERNKHIEIPYPYMLPKRIPNSITI